MEGDRGRATGAHRPRDRGATPITSLDPDAAPPLAVECLKDDACSVTIRARGTPGAGTRPGSGNGVRSEGIAGGQPRTGADPILNAGTGAGWLA